MIAQLLQSSDGRYHQYRIRYDTDYFLVKYRGIDYSNDYVLQFSK
jgi:hypothetical protein